MKNYKFNFEIKIMAFALNVKKGEILKHRMEIYALCISCFLLPQSLFYEQKNFHEEEEEKAIFPNKHKNYRFSIFPAFLPFQIKYFCSFSCAVPSRVVIWDEAHSQIAKLFVAPYKISLFSSKQLFQFLNYV